MEAKKKMNDQVNKATPWFHSFIFSLNRIILHWLDYKWSS